ncbi:MAG: T9SS type A sorting domain-containing protein [Bacteroidales bacterium]
MKKLTLQLAIVFCASALFAQWVPVNNGLPEYPPTSIINWVDTMVVSTYGGGLYLTYDQGQNWIEMPGTIPNLFVNKIEYQGTQFDPIGVSTDGGPIVCVNGGYIDCTGTGLTNTNINWWSAGYGGIVKDAVAGTRGSGVFAADYTSPFIYDWSPANAGLSGDALFINDGIVGESIAILATDGGIFKAEGNETEWTAFNNGLSGDALKVQDIYWLGVTLLATHGGLYYTLDMADGWSPIIPDEKFNVTFYLNTDLSPSGFIVYAFGENGFYTLDFETWIQMDFGGIEGEVTAASADEENVYIGFTIDSKGAKDSGGLYKKPLEQFLVGIDEFNMEGKESLLEQNYPNPFTKATRINYTLKNPGFVNLKVYDLFGKEVQTLVNEYQQSGSYSVKLESSHLQAGTYFYTLQPGNNKLETKRMVLIR